MHRFDYFILSTSLIFLSKITITRARQKQKTTTTTTQLDCLSNTNPCKNGGSCSLSTNRCLCPDGFSGELCEFVEPEVKCLSDRIEVHIQKSWAAHYAKVQSADQLYMGSDNEDLENCRAVDFDRENYIITVDGENSCGTDINRDNETLDFVYSNSVYSNRFRNKEKSGDDNDGSSKSHFFGLKNLIKRLPAFRLMSLVQWTCYYQHKDRSSTKSDSENEIDRILQQENIQFSNILPNSKSEIQIQTFSEPIFTSNHLLQPKTYKKSISGKSLFFEVITSSENFLIQECSISNKPGEKQEKVNDPNYHQKIIINSGGCVVPEMTSMNMPVTQILTNSPNRLRFAVILERNDWLEIGYENMDPTVYVNCIVQEAKFEKDNQNSCSGENFDVHDGFVEIEAGPFQILKEISEEEAKSIEIEGGDDEHSTGIRSRTRGGPPASKNNDNQKFSAIYEILESLENDAGETREAAWEKMKNFIETWEMGETLEEIPIVKVNSNYKIKENEKDDIPVFSVIKVENDLMKLDKMIILAIVVGCVFLILISTPVVITCYKNKTKNSKTEAKGRKTVEQPRSPVEKAVEIMKKEEDGKGINVDHELYFVEYADHVHDLVWGNNQQEQAGWIKQQSIDAQSIDISTSKPYDSSYDSGGTGTTFQAPIIPPRAVLPSYVVLGGKSENKNKITRKISDQLCEENFCEENNSSSSSSSHPRRGSIKLAGITTIFGSCSGASGSVPYKFKEKKRGHV